MAQTRKRSMKRNLKRGTMRTRSKPRKRVTKRRITGGMKRGDRNSIETEQEMTKRFKGMNITKNAANNAAAAAADAKKAANKARDQETPKYMVRPPALNQSDNAFGPLDQRNIEIFKKVISFMKNKGRDISFEDFITDDRFHPFLHFTNGSVVDLKNEDAPEYNKFKRVFNDIKRESSSYPTMDNAKDGVSNHELLQGLITELGQPKLA